MINASTNLQPVFYGYINVSDPLPFDDLEPNDGFWAGVQDYWVWASPIFGDRYSARNWIYERLRRCLFSGVPRSLLRRAGIPSLYFTVEEHAYPPEQAKKILGQSPIKADVFTQRNRVDPYFDSMIPNLLGKGSDDELKEQFRLPFLIDSYCDDSACMGGMFGRRGPEDPVIRLCEGASREAVEEDTERLLEFALLNRDWTIPDNAAVELGTASFPIVQITEHEDWVTFIFRDTAKYFVTAFEISSRTWLDQALTLHRIDAPVPPELEAEHRATIHYICSLLMHDFWVTEYRERGKILNPQRRAVSKGILPWLNRSQDGRVLIYRPHIRYLDQGIALDRIQSEDFFKTLAHRRAHFRDLHGRRKASLTQLLLAQEYGLNTPKGFTFVRPSGTETSDSIPKDPTESQPVFRCRSALRALANVQVFEDNKVRVEWEQFEQDIRDWLKASGFRILKPTWTKKGDGGIDVIAVKKTQGKDEVYCVQCKCWRSDRIVGMSVLREFETAVRRFAEHYDGFPVEIRKMIITTASFSSGSDFLAEVERQGVVLIDGVTFLQQRNTQG